jgi:hypothetical protein
MEERLNDIFQIGEIIKRGYFMGGRQARELPKIDIGGTLFYLDLRLNEFRECDNFINRINLDDLNEIEGGYQVWFDPKTKNYFEGSQDEFEKRKEVDLLWVKLPTLQVMDPMGFEWLMEEIREGSPIIARAHFQKVYHENESNQLEKVLDKAGLLYKTKNHPPVLEKKHQVKSKGKKL